MNLMRDLLNIHGRINMRMKNIFIINMKLVNINFPFDYIYSTVNPKFAIILKIFHYSKNRIVFGLLI